MLSFPNCKSMNPIPMTIKKKQDQPAVVCISCGRLYGKWWQNGEYSGPAHHAATFYVEDCDVCGARANCTEARDFGYLVPAWAEHAALTLK
jgi:transcription elongation factor Elf1